MARPTDRRPAQSAGTAPRPLPARAFPIALAGVLLAIGLAYANHFDNTFHFDDSHAVIQNPYVRSLAHVPRFFRDATTFSILPSNQSYRPVLQTTLALDYWLGGGYNARVFQTATFLWYLLLLAVLFVLVRGLVRAVDTPEVHARWLALGATALYGLHPVSAETVNYVIQRGDLLSTLGVAAALAVWALWPAGRRGYLWVLPLAFGMLAKPPAAVFPALVFGWVLATEASWRRALASSIGPGVAALALAIWVRAHEVPTFALATGTRGQYWLTQPWVALRYFWTFLVPAGLSADLDWPLLTSVADPRAATGLVFLVVLAAATAAAWRKPAWRPVAYGLFWFAIAQLPTAVVPIADVANDHRMFFPFIGLVLAAAWLAYRVWLASSDLQQHPRLVVAAAAVPLLALGWGTHGRNAVWHTDEALWHNVTQTSPANGRGWMNYGLTRMEKGDYPTAIASFERALPLTPDYNLLRINLGIAYGATGRVRDAQREFNEAIRLAPNDWRSHLYAGRWLLQSGNLGEAYAQLRVARAQNAVDLEAAGLLASAQAALDKARDAARTPPEHLNVSLAYYRAGLFHESIAEARLALQADPNYAEALNNVGAGYIGLRQWRDALEPLQRALALKPDFVVARNNLAQVEAALAAAGGRP